MMKNSLRRTLIFLWSGVLGGALVAPAAWIPVASAQECAPGMFPNPYTAQCLTPISTPIINGVPCVASKIGLCSSFAQNQQPPNGPRPVG